jgi:capsular exopolysaccharide synthesis family protein
MAHFEEVQTHVFVRPEVNRGSEPLDEGIDLRACWCVILKRARLIYSVTAGALLLTALVVFNQTPLYTARSTVLIQAQTPLLLSNHAIADTPGTDGDDYYETQYDILKSRSLADHVIRDLNLASLPTFTGDEIKAGFVAGLWMSARRWLSKDTTPAAADDDPEETVARPDLVDRFLRGLLIEPKIGTRLVIVSFSSGDPKLSARVANAQVNAYIQRGIELHYQASRTAEDFLQKKLAELKERVEKSEAALNNYRRDRGIVSFSLHEKSKILMRQLTDYGEDLTKTETQRIGYEAQSQLIREGDYESLPAVINSPLVQSLKEQGARLAAQYASMSNRFNPGYHPLDDLKARLDETERQLATEIRRIISGIKANYLTLTASKEMLRQEIDQTKSQVMALNDASLQDAVLEREVDADQQLYKSLVDRIKEIDVAADVPASNISVVDRAEPPRSPSSPRIMSSLALSVLLGLFGGLGIAFFLDYLDDRLKTPEETERHLGLPSLGIVPNFFNLNGATSASRYVSRQANIYLEAPYQPPSRELVVTRSRFGIATEAYRAIRTAILFSRAGGAPKTILITSATVSEGKTVTAINTALAFAQTGGRTLLVDTDLRHSRCHEILGVANETGLTEALTGQRDLREVLTATGIEGLFILSAGTSPPNPSELLASGKMRDILNDLEGEFDYILLDSAPLMPVSDTVALSTIADGVVVVIGPDTPRHVVRKACSRLAYAGAKIYGVVLNQVDFNSPDYSHYGRYYRDDRHTTYHGASN